MDKNNKAKSKRDLYMTETKEKKIDLHINGVVRLVLVTDILIFRDSHLFVSNR
jgi:hypothetical protein